MGWGTPPTGWCVITASSLRGDKLWERAIHGEVVGQIAFTMAGCHGASSRRELVRGEPRPRILTYLCHLILDSTLE